MNEVIALDVDDVLCAFSPYAHQYHKIPMEGRIDYWCEKTMNSRLGEFWFTEHIAPIEEFWRTIPTLSRPEDIDFEVSYYISAFPEDMYRIRLQWLRDNGFPEAPLVCSVDKLRTCKELRVTVLVDDKPGTIKLLQKSPIKGIHFYNHYAGFEPIGDYITNLNQVKDRINGRKEGTSL